MKGSVEGGVEMLFWFVAFSKEGMGVKERSRGVCGGVGKRERSIRFLESGLVCEVD